MYRFNFIYLTLCLVGIIGATIELINACATYKALDKLYLVVHEENHLINAITGLKELAAKIGEKIADADQEAIITRRDNGSFEADITPYLTDRMRDILFKGRLCYDGPNCWNAVLYFLKVIDHLRYTSEDEINYYLLNSGLFMDVTSDIREAGDVGALYNNNEIMHTFIHLSDETIIDKVGYSQKDKYRILYFDKMLEKYKDHEVRYYRLLPHEVLQNILIPIKYEILLINHFGENVSRMLKYYVTPPKKRCDLALIIKEVLLYDKYVANLVNQLSNSIFGKIIFYAWESVFYQLEDLLKNMNIDAKSLSGKSYSGSFREIYLNKKKERLLTIQGKRKYPSHFYAENFDISSITIS